MISQQYEPHIDAVDIAGFTPLLHAAINGSLAVAQATKGGDTRLYIAPSVITILK